MSRGLYCYMIPTKNGNGKGDYDFVGIIIGITNLLSNPHPLRRNAPRPPIHFVAEGHLTTLWPRKHYASVPTKLEHHKKIATIIQWSL